MGNKHQAGISWKGKGAADGVGAAVKPAADEHVVVKKNDKTCAKNFIGLLGQQQSTKVKLFRIGEIAIRTLDKPIPGKLSALLVQAMLPEGFPFHQFRPISSTLKIHQAQFKQNLDHTSVKQSNEQLKY